MTAAVSGFADFAPWARAVAAVSPGSTPAAYAASLRACAQIAPALESDAEDVAKVLLAAFRDFAGLYTPEGFRATTPCAKEIADRLVEGRTWVAKDGATVVGTVSAVERGEEAYIRSMAVLPEFRGLGVAHQLLRQAEALAVSRGARRLSLTTTPFLTAAIRLYEQAGFRRVPGRLDLHGTPLFVMIKDLSAAE